MGRMSIRYHWTGTLANRVKGKVDKARAKISMRLFATWRRAINSTGISANAKRRYREALIPYRPPRVGVYVTDYVAQLIEKGWKSFDMRPGLLKGLLSRAIPIGDSGEIRTVSQASPAGSWKHPGYKGARVHDRIKKQTMDVVQTVINKVISE